MSPSTVAPGGSVTLTVYIKNVGSEIGTVKVYAGIQKPSGAREYLAPHTISNIAVGQTQSTSWGYTPSAGTGQYWVDFDVYSPPETHMFDTTGFVHSLRVTSQSDPTATRISPSSSSVSLQVGDTQTFVANLSDADCDLNYAEWYLAGTYMHTDPSPERCSSPTSWTWTFTSAGTFDVTIVVYDSRNDGSHVGWTSWSVGVGTGSPPPPPPGECSKSADGRYLRFSGYDWEIKSGQKGPGDPVTGNAWRTNNVECDAQGHLRLKITSQAGTWTNAEIWTNRTDLGFGRYEFKVRGDLDNLDRNVVLGLFNYPPPGDPLRPDGTNEIDIEFARWGDAGNLPGNYGVYPYSRELQYQNTVRSFWFEQAGATATTHRFFWQGTQVHFESFEDDRQFGEWTFAPPDYPSRIPQRPLPVHINLWLFRGMAPSNGLGTEIVIESFTWTPDAIPAGIQLPLPIPPG